MILWLSRDSYGNGELMPGISLWDVRPDRHHDPDRVLGVIWSTKIKGILGHIAMLTIAEAQDLYVTIPETDLELIRIERPD